ncbi:MAG: S9 family peptidase [Bacteroidetes bacterium]|nr:MAG: S9 family peptidase [Bacteroidota bacterium]
MKKYRKFNLLILSILVTSSIFAQQNSFKKITVDDLWKNWTFWTNSVYGVRSMNDGIHYSTSDRVGNIVKYSYETGEVTDTIFKAVDAGINPGNYEFNSDESKILLQTNYKRIYRRSFTAEYFVYDVQTKKLNPVSENGNQQIASFSPDSKKIAFVRKNNLYIKNLETGKETQITFDGEHNKIINGIPDWVYEEEFEFNKAYEWSPDGKTIAYIKFNESKVKMFGMTMFAGSHPELIKNKLYPECRSFKYPKAGESNSVVSIHIYNIETQKTIDADIGKKTDIYIPRIRWTKDINKLAIFRLNRLQNKFELLFADPNNGNTNVVYTETNKYYIDEANFDNLRFLDDGKHFVMTSERDGYRHLYLHDINGKEVKQLTSGKWDVTDFYGYDKNRKLFYFQSAEESPVNRAVYKVNIKGTKKNKLSEQLGTNKAEFSKNFNYYINYFSNSETPNYVTLHNTKGDLIRILEENKRVKKLVNEYGGVNKEFFSFKTSEGIELNAWMIKPPDFDNTKKYPVVITQYSGPGSQEVLNHWDFGWDNLLAQQGIVMVCVDSRGTGARGEDFRKLTYLELGKYETIDLIETAKWLQNQDYVNPEKIGIWGWSYGGFMTSLCMTKGADYFSTGIAVAPVTNWRYYDNIYTERFMRTPQENPNGYDDNSPINFADKLKGDFLLVHGTGDDNVHWQNSAEFSEALVQANKQFNEFYYTNRNHSIYGGNTRYHLYTMMLNFWKKHLLN